jgi:predicted nucleotidyltransferase
MKAQTILSIDEIKKIVLPVLRRHDVRHAAIFGSVARGDASPSSDLDLLVDLPTGKTLLDLVGLQLDLQDLLGYDIDVVTYPELHPRMQERVFREQVPIL